MPHTLRSLLAPAVGLSGGHSSLCAVRRLANLSLLTRAMPWLRVWYLGPHTRHPRRQSSWLRGLLFERWQLRDSCRWILYHSWPTSRATLKSRRRLHCIRRHYVLVRPGAPAILRLRAWCTVLLMNSCVAHPWAEAGSFVAGYIDSSPRGDKTASTSTKSVGGLDPTPGSFSSASLIILSCPVFKPCSITDTSTLALLR